MKKYVLSVNDLKTLRETTGAGVADCRMALETTGGDMKKAAEVLRQKGIEKADKKSEREVRAGGVFAYQHHNGKMGSLVGMACETDFVAKTDDFKKLGAELALQVATMKPESVEKLLEQEYVRDGSKSVLELMKETIGKLGENIKVTEIKLIEI